ncbi:unnamed protein product, partial [Laminaria digitata]
RPSPTPAPPPAPAPPTPSDFVNRNAKQGLEIRELKKSKPDKATITPHINALLSLKAQYKEKAGKDYTPAPAAAPAAAVASKKEAVAAPAGGAATEESPAAAEISAK